MEVSAVVAMVAASDSDLLAQMMADKSYDEMVDGHRMASLSAVFAAKVKLLFVLVGHEVVVVVSSPHQSPWCGVLRVEKFWKFWLPTMTVGNPAAMTQLSFGSTRLP